MSRVSLVRGVFWLWLLIALLVGGVGIYGGWKFYQSKRLQSSQNEPPSLREDTWSVRYASGGKASSSMLLDVLDARQTLHLPFLVRTGMVGLKDQPQGELSKNGFPPLALMWPSLHVPTTDWCVNAQVATPVACPVFSVRLSSRPMTEKEVDLLNTKAHLPDQESLAVPDRTVSLWSAFTTVNRDSGGAWAGWICELDYLVDKNEDLQAWGLQEGVFPIDLADTTCHVPTTRLTRFWPELAYRSSTIGGYEMHPVIWQCPLRKGADCEVQFEHRGRLVTLEIPGGVMLGDEPQSKFPHISVRPRLVQAAWTMLENAAKEAAEASDATQQRQRWQEALQKELTWCEALSKHSAAFQEKQTPAVAKKLQAAWSNPPWLISSPHPRGPCARSFHRLVHLVEFAEASKNPASALPAAIWTQALSAAQRLAAVEKKQTQKQSEPVWHLVDQLMTYAAGSGAASTVTVARLSWHNTPEHLQRDPMGVLALLDAAGDAVTQMPAADSIQLRMNLAWALERHAQAGSADAASADRIMTLFLQASQTWLSLAEDPLSPVDSVALLTHTANHVRAFGNRLAADGSRREAEAAQVLVSLVKGMEKLAQRIAQQPEIGVQARVAHLGTLAVHAAWHAQHLAFLPMSDTPPAPAVRGRPPVLPLDPTWVLWLEQWTQWQTTQLLPLPQGARLIAGVEVHRDATRTGKQPSINCPGAHLLDCKMAQP